jgi:hypothetical protein
MPREAFLKRADQGNIIICVDQDQNKCVGYVLFYEAKQRVKLTHLCVTPKYRGLRITKKLLYAVREKTPESSGILASCRRDYDLSQFWTSLGFAAIHERKGRSQQGTILTEWWLDYCQPNLFTSQQFENASRKIPVVIDANIFFDLTNEDGDYAKDSQALLADWLASEIEIFITYEIYNEIDRNRDSEERQHLRTSLNKFSLLLCQADEVERYSQEIRYLFPENMKKSDSSDLKHLARTIGASVDIEFFVTKDNRLLEEVDPAIFDLYKLKIISPADLITRIDEIQREVEYQPAKLAGTKIIKKRVSQNLESILNCFLENSQGESKSELRTKLKSCFSDPVNYECMTIGREGSEEPFAFFASQCQSNLEAIISILRYKEIDVSFLVVRHFILELIHLYASQGISFLRITEKYLKPEIRSFLKQQGFVESQHGWTKLNLNICGSPSEISVSVHQTIQGLDEICREKFVSLVATLNVDDVEKESIHKIERFLFPAKVVHASMPTFLVPIKPWWAKDLFDAELAESILWGAEELIAFKIENAYYKSTVAPKNFDAPARVLWYVSKGNGEMGANNVALSAVRACSLVQEIVRGKPKELYRKFRRLGVYQYSHLLETANNNPKKDILAIKFSHTELFGNPIPLTEIRRMTGKNTSVQSVSFIEPQVFRMIYNTGVLSG